MYEVKLHFKSALFSINYRRTSRLFSFYSISNNKNLTPKYLVNALTDLNSLNIKAAIVGKVPVNDFGRAVPSFEKYGCK